MVPITEGANMAELWEVLASQSSGQSFKSSPASFITYASFPSFKSRCMFVESRSRQTDELIDICKTADLVLLLSKESIIDNALIDEVRLFTNSMNTFKLLHILCT